MKRNSAIEIATEIADALEKISDPELRYVACQKIVAHAIKMDRNRKPASAQKEIYHLGLTAEYFRREKKDAAAAALLAKAAHRIGTLIALNGRLRSR
jgi:hypothetical protein